MLFQWSTRVQPFWKNLHRWLSGEHGRGPADHLQQPAHRCAAQSDCGQHPGQRVRLVWVWGVQEVRDDIAVWVVIVWSPACRCRLLKSRQSGFKGLAFIIFLRSFKASEIYHVHVSLLMGEVKVIWQGVPRLTKNIPLSSNRNDHVIWDCLLSWKSFHLLFMSWQMMS